MNGKIAIRLTRKGRLQADRIDADGLPSLVTEALAQAADGNWLDAKATALHLQARGQEITDLPMMGIALHLREEFAAGRIPSREFCLDVFRRMRAK